MYIRERVRRIDSARAAELFVLLAVVTVIVYCFGMGISGNDFWWHIKAGEYIYTQRAVPKQDIFSWYGMEQALPWTAHEWLAELIFFLIFRGLGPGGIYLFSILAALVLAGLMWKQGRRYARDNLLFSGLFMALFAVLTSLFFYGRPHIFSFFLLFFELRLLYGLIENEHSRGVFLIPLLAVLWSNLHGGSANLSYLLCFLFLLTGQFDFRAGRLRARRLSRKSRLSLALSGAGAAAGILVNPVGPRVFVYPYRNLADRVSMALISEWQPPDAKVVGQLILFFLPVALICLGILLSERELRLVDLGVLLVFLYLFFRSARFIILWYIAAVFCGFPYMIPLRIAPFRRTAEKAAVLFGLLAMLLPLGTGLRDIAAGIRRGDAISMELTAAAAEEIRRDAPRRLFNDYNLGGCLIYYEIPVFFDSRADLFAADGSLADGLSLMLLEQANRRADTAYADVDALLERYSFDAVLILRSRPLYTYMRSHPERFEVIREDDTAAYFQIIAAG